MCSLKAIGSVPWFSCTLLDDPKIFESRFPSAVMKDMLKYLNCSIKRHWSGYEFFGLSRKEVASKLVVCPKNKMVSEHNDILADIVNIRCCQGGPTHLMKSKQAKDSRHGKIEKIVDFASFGDVPSFISYLIDKYPDVVDDTILKKDEYKEHLGKIIGKARKVKLSIAESAGLLMPKAGLSQREYIQIKLTLAEQNVQLASYDEVSSYLKNLNVGSILLKVCNCLENCMSIIC